MSGMRTSTATGIATTRIHWGIIDTSPQRSAASRADVRHRTTVAATIDVFDSEQVPGANPDTGGSVFWSQRSQHLHDVAVDFGGHEAVAVRIEPRRRLHLVLETTLQCERGGG